MREDGISTAPVRAGLMVTVSRLVAGALVLLGILGLLRTAGEDGTPTLTVFSVHPLTGLAWTILGLVGVAMSTSLERTRRYLVGAGVLLVAWAVLCLVLNGEPSNFFIRDTELIALNGVLGLLALTAAGTEVPARLIGTTE
jgi:hypothetical protein